MTKRSPTGSETQIEPSGGDVLPSPRDTAAPTAPGSNGWPAGTRPWSSQDLEAEEGTEGGLDLGRYLAAVNRFKWLILAITIVGISGGVFATRFLPSVFRAAGTLWVEKVDENGSGPIRSGQLLDTYSWVQLLRSFELLEQVVRERRLFLLTESEAQRQQLSALRLTGGFIAGRYQFIVDEGGSGFTLRLVGAGAERGRFGDSVGTSFGFEWVPERVFAPGTTTEFVLRHPRDAAMAISSSLTAQPTGDGNLMTVELMGGDPEGTAETLNVLLARFIDLAADLKRARLTTAREVLDEQVAAAQRNLAAAEQELEQFRVNTITLPAERLGPVPAGLEATRDPVFADYFRMSLELDQKRHDREVLEEVLRRIPTAGVPIDRLATVAAALSSRELEAQIDRLVALKSERAALMSRYTEEHPAVQEVTGNLETLERRTIPGQLERLITAVDAQIADLEARVESASANLQAIPERTIEETRLVRAVDIADELYTDLRQRLQSAHLAEATSIPDVSILDRAAVPQVPIANRAPMIVLMAAAGSLGAALGLAILLDMFDRRVRYPEEVTKGLGLSLLGTIPRADHGRGSKRVLQVAQVVEAFRGIRLNLVHSFGPGGNAITITSPGAGDGKSFLASNLALAFAEAGYRTVVVDADTRKGQLHHLFQKERCPGLTDALTGTRAIAEVVHPTDFPHLEIIPCGTRSSRAPELLGSAGMHRLLTDLKARHDVVIIDSPPMGAGVDAFALASLTGHLLLVLRTGTSDREMTRMKLTVADRLPIRVLGAVLNDVRYSSSPRYYTGYSYYMPGYEAEDEKQELDSSAIGVLRGG